MQINTYGHVLHVHICFSGMHTKADLVSPTSSHAHTVNQALTCFAHDMPELWDPLDSCKLIQLIPIISWTSSPEIWQLINSDQISVQGPMQDWRFATFIDLCAKDTQSTKHSRIAHVICLISDIPRIQVHYFTYYQEGLFYSLGWHRSARGAGGD